MIFVVFFHACMDKLTNPKYGLVFFSWNANKSKIVLCFARAFCMLADSRGIFNDAQTAA